MGKLPERFPNIELHEFVVMPNHFHGILEIVGATLVVAQKDPDLKDILVAADQQNKGTDQGNTNDGNIVDTNAHAFMITDSKNGEDESLARVDQSLARTDQSLERATTRVAPTSKTVGDMIAAFKSITTVEYIRGVNNAGWDAFDGRLWQRNYHDHIIRDFKSYKNIAGYISNNPARWSEDKFYRA